MKIKRTWSNVAKVTYSVELSEYDATPPATAFTVDGFPRSLNANREAIALYLIFGHWAGEEFETPFPFSPHVAEAMIRDFRPARLLPRPIEYYPKGLPIGSKLIECESGRPSHKINTFTDLGADQWNGSVRSHSSLSVATNSFVFKRHEEDIRPMLGSAVLFSENLGADILQVSTRLEPEKLERLTQLLASVRLEFRAPE